MNFSDIPFVGIRPMFQNIHHTWEALECVMEESAIASINMFRNNILYIYWIHWIKHLHDDCNFAFKARQKLDLVKLLLFGNNTKKITK